MARARRTGPGQGQAKPPDETPRADEQSNLSDPDQPADRWQARAGGSRWRGCWSSHHGFKRSYNWLRLSLQAHGRRRAAPRRGAHRRKRRTRPSVDAESLALSRWWAPGSPTAPCDRNELVGGHRRRPARPSRFQVLAEAMGQRRRVRGACRERHCKGYWWPPASSGRRRRYGFRPAQDRGTGMKKPKAEWLKVMAAKRDSVGRPCAVPARRQQTDEPVFASSRRCFGFTGFSLRDLDKRPATVRDLGALAYNCIQRNCTSSSWRWPV